MRLPSFGDSLFGDELSTYYIVTGHGLGRALDLLRGNTADLNPPLLFVLAWITERLGDPAQSIRIASLISGTAAIPLTFVLGRWTVGRPAALVGAALTALSPYLIFYSTEARAYSLVLCLVLVSSLALVRALQTGRAAWWVVYAVASCAAMYAHYPALFVLVAQFGWAFATRAEARRALLAANLAAAVGYLPWLPTLADNTGSPGAKVIELLEPFGPHVVRVDLGRWAFGHPYMPTDTMPGTLALALLAAGLALGAAGLVAILPCAPRSRRLARPSSGLVLVVVLALATPVLIGLYSLVGDSVWNARNLAVSWPGLALCAGALLTSAGGVVRVAAVTLVLAAFAIGAVRMLEADSQRPDYAAAARFIERTGRPTDPVVEAPVPSPGPLTPVGDVALNHYGRPDPGRHPVLRLGVAPLAAALRARPYESPPVPRPEEIAGQAARLAAGRTLFLVVPGTAPLARLRSTGVTARTAGLEPAFGTGPPAAFVTAGLSPVHPFVRALPPRFRLIRATTVPGIMPVTVYAFRAADR